MKSVILPTTPDPSQLPSHIDIRDFELSNGKFVRVHMELNLAVVMGHYEMSAQTWELDAEGRFVQAPHGYPSRTSATKHTIPASALNDTVFLDNAWLRYVGMADQSDVDGYEKVTSRPTEPGKEFGQIVWDTSINQGWQWTEGYADSVARAKVYDMENVIQSSEVRSFGFRRS